eukprot:858011-Prorocentrum_minimum.AAC.1
MVGVRISLILGVKGRLTIDAKRKTKRGIAESETGTCGVPTKSWLSSSSRKAFLRQRLRADWSASMAPCIFSLFIWFSSSHAVTSASTCQKGVRRGSEGGQKGVRRGLTRQHLPRGGEGARGVSARAAAERTKGVPEGMLKGSLRVR